MHCRIFSTALTLSLLVAVAACTRPEAGTSNVAVVTGNQKPVDGIGFSGTDEASKRAAAVWQLLLKTLTKYSATPDAFLSYTCPSSLLNDPDCIFLSTMNTDPQKRAALSAFITEATTALGVVHNAVTDDNLIKISDGALQVSDPNPRSVDARTSRTPPLVELNRAVILAALPNVLGKIIGHEAGHLVRAIVDKSPYLVFDKGEDILDYFGIVTSRMALEESKGEGGTTTMNPIPTKWSVGSGRMVRYHGGVNDSAVELFAIGQDNLIESNMRLRGSYPANGGWRGWDDIPGNFAAQSLGSIARYGGGDYPAIEVFAVGTDTKVYSNILKHDGTWAANGGWRGWMEIPGGAKVKALSAELAQYAGDVLEIFAIGNDDRVYSNVLFRDGSYAATGGWRGWVALPTTFKAASIGGVVQYHTGATFDAIEISAVGQDNKVYTNVLFRDGTYAATGGWRGWANIGNQAAAIAVGGMAQYAVTGSLYDAFQVFSLAPNGQPLTNLEDRVNGWSGSTTIGNNFTALNLGGLVQFPNATPKTELELTAVGTDYRVYTNTYLRDGTAWQGWGVVPDMLR